MVISLNIAVILHWTKELILYSFMSNQAVRFVCMSLLPVLVSLCQVSNAVALFNMDSELDVAFKIWGSM